MGTWDWDVLADISPASEQVAAVWPAGERIRPPLAAYLDCIHPADRAAIERALAMRCWLANDSDHQVAHRVLWPDGSLHWLEEQGRVLPRCRPAGQCA